MPVTFFFLWAEGIGTTKVDWTKACVVFHLWLAIVYHQAPPTDASEIKSLVYMQLSTHPTFKFNTCKNIDTGTVT